VNQIKSKPGVIAKEVEVTIWAELSREEKL
jgi:hypothetical protein